MTDLHAISEAIQEWAKPQEEGGFIVVPTFALYPSNAGVQVFIDGDRNSFSVSDGGGAIETLLKAGDFREDARPGMKAFVRRWGLSVDRAGWIYASNVAADEVTSIVPVVADCSKQAAEFLLRRQRPTVAEDFRPELDRLIKERFHSTYQPDGAWVGASNKSHRFDYVIRLGNERVGLVDAVRPDTNSINSAIVAHIDVAMAANENVQQRIVYDDRLEWKAADLVLLRVARAQAVAFSNIQSALDRLAA